MPSNPKLQLIFPLLIILTLPLLFSPSSSSSSQPTPTVYQILQNFSLPSGLLPDSVKSYTLNKDGTFEVQLLKSCYIHFDYLVYYQEKITGKLSVGAISDLKGIQVQKFFVWLDVDEIRVDMSELDSIYFQVGFISKRLDVAQFQIVRSCQDKAFRKVTQLPEPMEDIQMLITE